MRDELRQTDLAVALHTLVPSSWDRSDSRSAEHLWTWSDGFTDEHVPERLGKFFYHVGKKVYHIFAEFEMADKWNTLDKEECYLEGRCSLALRLTSKHTTSCSPYPHVSELFLGSSSNMMLVNRTRPECGLKFTRQQLSRPRPPPHDPSLPRSGITQEHDAFFVACCLTRPGAS